MKKHAHNFQLFFFSKFIFKIDVIQKRKVPNRKTKKSTRSTTTSLRPLSRVLKCRTIFFVEIFNY